jgi:hypothetical protein
MISGMGSGNSGGIDVVGPCVKPVPGSEIIKSGPVNRSFPFKLPPPDARSTMAFKGPPPLIVWKPPIPRLLRMATF